MRFSLSTLSTWTKGLQHDFYFKEAKKLGFVSRAAFKLQEIQKKHKIIKPGGTILDLGCSPGAWLQVACSELGDRSKGGIIVGVDIQETVVPDKFCDDRVVILKGDAREIDLSILAAHAPKGFSTVLSDMLHFTSGVNDVERSLELASTALCIATGSKTEFLKPNYSGLTEQDGYRGCLVFGGNFATKLYDGNGSDVYVNTLRGFFKKVVRMRVSATRHSSREIYVVGIDRQA
mmetsp:Transcript_30221/g.55217  ORF Transcript_30221/g.55217 Transcript_30221/m.55217 type:complete len:233 (-) Transcript_30221:333-1031(-)